MTTEPRPTSTIDSKRSEEAKAFVTLAFRNGPIEDVHAGKLCPTCGGNGRYTHITQDEMRKIMKNAVNQVYQLLWQRDNGPDAYNKSIEHGSRYTTAWDDPEL